MGGTEMTNTEKVKKIYIMILTEQNGWDKNDAEKAFAEDGIYDPLYQRILDILNED